MKIIICGYGLVGRNAIERLQRSNAEITVIDIDPEKIADIPYKKVVGDATNSYEDNVDLFPRFAIMRHWKIAQGLPFSAFVSPDGLHMNDWGYGCWAKLLAGALQEAATRGTSTATAVPGLR